MSSERKGSAPVEDELLAMLRFYRAQAPQDLVEFALQCPDHRRLVLELLVYEVHHLKAALKRVTEQVDIGVGFADVHDDAPKGN